MHAPTHRVQLKGVCLQQQTQLQCCLQHMLRDNRCKSRCICMRVLQRNRSIRWMPVADLKDWAAEGDVEEGLHRGSQRGAPRHHEPDPPTEGCLHCLQHCAVYQGAQLHTVRDTFRCLSCIFPACYRLRSTPHAWCAAARLITSV